MTETAAIRTHQLLRSRILRQRELLIVLAVALLARVLYWVLVTLRYSPESDAAQYVDLARNIIEGRGYSMMFPQLEVHPTAFRPPGYPYALAAVFKVFGVNVAAGRVLSLVFGVAAIALVYLLVRRISTPVAALVCGLCMALYPPLLANDTVLLTESMSLALLAGLMLALAARRWPIAAVVCGMLILTRASAQYLVVLLALWVLWQFGWKRALGFLAIVVVVVSPWFVRNQIQLGSALYVTSNGFNLAGTYSPAARESEQFVDPVIDSRFSQFRLAQFDEADWQNQLQAFAIADVKTHPMQVPGVLYRNATHLFEFTPQFNEWAENADGRNVHFRNGTLWIFYLLTAVGVFGLVVSRRDPVVVLIGATGLYFVLGSLVLVSPPRLRSPFDMCCCIGVGLAAQWWAARRSSVTGIIAEEGDDRLTPVDSSSERTPDS
jgi:4-amino-4-deoxy-L-arabinose transferase-like glycosyltransferase